MLGASRSCRLTRGLVTAPSRLKALLFRLLLLRPLYFVTCEVNLRASRSSMNKLEFYPNRNRTERVAPHEFSPLYTRVSQIPAALEVALLILLVTSYSAFYSC